ALQRLRAKVRGDLIVQYLPVTRSRPWGQIASGLPLVDTTGHEIGHRCLGGFHIRTTADRGNEGCEFCLRLFLAAGLHRDVLGAAFSVLAREVEFQAPRILTASAYAALHGRPLSVNLFSICFSNSATLSARCSVILIAARNMVSSKSFIIFL